MTQETVLVTGINGYIATHIAVQLFKKGYIVRGTSRSAAAEQQLLSEAFKGHESQYQHYVVADITVAGAFDEAAKGVNAVIHVASPVDFSLTSVDAFFGPAIGGVLSIADSCQKAGPQLKSLVMTSSIAAVADRWKNPPDYVYTDTDWNTSAEKVARENFLAPIAYSASKAVAEKALWDWQNQHHPSFSIAAVLPGVVMGPPVSWPATPDKLNETLAPIWNLYSGRAKTLPPQIGKAAAVDVRDVAALHVWCMENPKEAAGQRYIAAMGKLPPQGMADIIRAAYPDRQILEGNPGEGYVPETFEFPEGDGGFVVDKAVAALGGKRNIIPLQTTILDTVEAFAGRWPDQAHS